MAEDPLETTPLVAPTRGRPQQRRHHSFNEKWMASEVWTTESMTPMTSRPHSYASTEIPRVRSVSLGPSLDRARLQKHVNRLIDGRHSFALVAPKPTPSQEGNAQEKVEATNPLSMSIMYGMINATIVLPILLSFGAIIYRNAAFAPYMPVLVKLTVISGIIHQLTFAALSSLPFAVGQVQDAGLIFLSSMASHIVEYCRVRNYDDSVLLATTVILLSASTAILGIGLVLIGRWQLAQYVQRLPTCVVGGYLAFIGWFCGFSAIGIMDNGENGSWKLLLPGLAGGVLMYLAVRRLRHMAVLPTFILLLLLSFHVTLWLTGTSVAEATAAGWIRHMDKAPPLFQTWNYFDFSKVAWGVVPDLIVTEVSMIFVVALSSSLDVAAIELELQKPLDYNGELQMVGISNMLSGLTGGYTGSYIFSQSIFSLRAGIRSRTSGLVLAACECLILVLPVPILQYVPNLFFGSLLTMICLDLMYEWLVDVRHKLNTIEYGICLGTFGLILATGVEYGILLGVALYLIARQIWGSNDDGSVEQVKPLHT